MAAGIIRPLPAAKAYLLVPMISHRDAATRPLLSDFTNPFFFVECPEEFRAHRDGFLKRRQYHLSESSLKLGELKNKTKTKETGELPAGISLKGWVVRT